MAPPNRESKNYMGQRPSTPCERLALRDRGSQYTGLDFAQALDDHHLLQSVGSFGGALDNALAESFVDTIKTGHLNRPWASFGTARSVIRW